MLSLSSAEVARLLAAHRFAARTLERTIALKFTTRSHGQPLAPHIELSFTLPIAVHSSATAAGNGWDLASCVNWVALPRAFSPSLLGPPNPGFAKHAYLRSAIKVGSSGWTSLQLYTDESDADLPARFDSEPLPIDELYRWQRSRVWLGEFLMHETLPNSD